MAKLRFITRTTGDAIASVYVFYQSGAHTRLRIATPMKIPTELWDNKKQLLTDKADKVKADLIRRMKAEGKTHDEIFETVQKIDNFESDMKALKNRIEVSSVAHPSKEWLEGIIKLFFPELQKKELERPKETFNQYIRRFVSEAESGERLANFKNVEREYTYGSLRSLRGFMLSYEMFCGTVRAEKKDPLTGDRPIIKEDKQYRFEDITLEWYNKYLNFFRARNCGENYIGRNIKTMKTILRAAREEPTPLHNNLITEHKKFKVLSEPATDIYLTQDEVDSIARLDLAHEPHFQAARDVFLVGVYIAQRYSDYGSLKPDNIDLKANLIRLTQKKTGATCIIPIKPELHDILKRQETPYQLPKTHEQKVNKYIKEIGRMAGIDGPIEKKRTIGGKEVTSTARKYQMIKTHTARRTGCSLMYLAGIPPIDIMKISGHVTEKEFLKYIKVSKEETAQKLQTHEYFTNLRVAK